MQEKSKVSMVINGLMLSWECPSGIWNEGYIAKWWQKFESGQTTWDTSIERKAGGIEISQGMDFKTLSAFIVANASSIMALIRAVVGHVMRTGACPAHLVDAFSKIRITWLLCPSKYEIVNLSTAENIDQHMRRRHTEFDNIFQVPILKKLDINKATGPDHISVEILCKIADELAWPFTFLSRRLLARYSGTYL